MGRIVDLCGEIAAAADEGPEGMVLPPDVWERLRQDWSDEDIEDAMGFVKESILQSELVESADSLSARLLELLGTWGDAQGWRDAVEGRAVLGVDVIRQIAHRLDRLEEILEVYRDEKAPDRRAFDRLQRRLMDEGIEEEMQTGAPFSAEKLEQQVQAERRRAETAESGRRPTPPVRAREDEEPV